MNSEVIVLIQALSAGMIMWRAAHEKIIWDKIGFVLLACAAGFMVWRRITARLEYHHYLDSVTLPTIITILSTAAAGCFVVEAIVRALKEREKKIQVSGTYLWPFLLFIFISATSFPQESSVLSSVNELNQEDLRREALFGTRAALAVEQLRWDCSVNIDTLRIISERNDEVGEIAKRKLQAIKLRLEGKNDRRN